MKFRPMQFHAADYVDFLKKVTPDNEKKYQSLLQKCKFQFVAYIFFHTQNKPRFFLSTPIFASCAKMFGLCANAVSIGEQTDCPIFNGMFEFCQMYTGASLG